MNNREELAWAAGFFDGEGHVRRKRGNRHEITITQLDRHVLDRFRLIFGLGQVFGPYACRGRVHPLHRYQVSGQPNVQAICAMLWPWLSPIKREQFRGVLAGASRLQARHTPPCEHGKRRGQCWDCMRRLPKTRPMANARTRRYRLIRKTAAALLVAS